LAPERGLRFACRQLILICTAAGSSYRRATARCCSRTATTTRRYERASSSIRRICWEGDEPSGGRGGGAPPALTVIYEMHVRGSLRIRIPCGMRHPWHYAASSRRSLSAAKLGHPAGAADGYFSSTLRLLPGARSTIGGTSPVSFFATHGVQSRRIRLPVDEVRTW